jgi:rhamnosyltransferase
LKNKLEKAIDLLESENGFGYSSNVTAFWEAGREKIIKKSYPQCKYDYLFESPGPGCSFVIKKELALLIKNRLKLAPSRHTLDWHDWIIYAFARKNNFKWIIDRNPYVLYRQHIENQLGANVGYVAFIKRVKDIISGYGINQTMTIIKFLGMENDSFVDSWYINGQIRYLTLSLYSNECRRNRWDKLMFFVSCIIMSIIKPKIL